jgi:hypothetical protein
MIRVLEWNPRRQVRRNPMSRGEKIAVGALVAIAVTGAGVALYRSMSEAKAETKKELCPVVDTTQIPPAQQMATLVAWTERWNGKMDEPASGLPGITDLMASMFPQCDWSGAVDRQIIGDNGTVQWLALRGCALTHTLRDTLDRDGPCAPLYTLREGATAGGLFSR